MTDHDRALLDRLIALRTEELAELGADEIEVTAASYVRGLIRREAKAKGVMVPAAPPIASAPQEAPASPESPAKPKPQTPEEESASVAQAALLRAIEKGAGQAQIATRAGIDPGALSKFKRTGRGLSSQKVRKLLRALS